MCLPKSLKVARNLDRVGIAQVIQQIFSPNKSLFTLDASSSILTALIGCEFTTAPEPMYRILMTYPLKSVVKRFEAVSESAAIKKVIRGGLFIRVAGVELPFFISFGGNSEGNFFHMTANVQTTPFVPLLKLFLAESTCTWRSFNGSVSPRLVKVEALPRVVLCLGFVTIGRNTYIGSKVIYDMTSERDYQQ